MLTQNPNPHEDPEQTYRQVFFEAATALNRVANGLQSVQQEIRLMRLIIESESVTKLEIERKRKLEQLIYKPIEILQLKGKALNALKRLGCVTVKDVTKVRPRDLMELEYIGTATVQEVRYTLQEHDLKMRGDVV